MKKTLRFVALAATLAAAGWLGQPWTSEATQSCSNLTNPCTIGTTVICGPGDDFSSCKCVNIGGRGYWLCTP